MATSVVMPALEMAQETGKVVAWLKQEGDPVVKGEPLLEVETDKAVVEVEALAGGILAGVTARAGDVVPVGQTVAWLVQPGEAPPAHVAPAASGRRMDATHAAADAATGATAAAAAPAGRVSPKARRLAKEHGIDLGRVRGSGAGGEIVAEDVLVLVGSQAPGAGAPEAAAVEPLTSIGRLMAERTTQSWTSVPHFFVVREIDASALVAARDRLAASVGQDRGVKLTQTDLLIALVGGVLRRHPRMNASWAGDRVRTNADVNVAVAMAVEDGVVAAVIPHADRASLADIAARRRDLTERARAGRLQPADITGATFTVSNLGMYQVDAFTAIIVPPQAGILAVGAIADRAVAEGGQVAVRPMMTLTLSCDHRVVDGARAAAFLNDMASATADPDALLR